MPIVETESTILDVIEGDVLALSFVTRVLDSAFVTPPDDRVALETERARVSREIENLTVAVTAGGDIPALVAMLRERDKRLKLLDVRLTTRDT